MLTIGGLKTCSNSSPLSICQHEHQDEYQHTSNRLEQIFLAMPTCAFICCYCLYAALVCYCCTRILCCLLELMPVAAAVVVAWSNVSCPQQKPCVG